jgi:hypothetical protein
MDLNEIGLEGARGFDPSGTGQYALVGRCGYDNEPTSSLNHMDLFD